MDAPTITQTVPTTGEPIASGTEVATLASAGATSYAISRDDSSMFSVAGDKLTLTQEGNGAFYVEVTATDGTDTSIPGTATLVFADDGDPSNDDAHILDDYGDNPQFPPATADADTWQFFIVSATHAIRPHAREGVDFAVGRTAKDAPLENTAWDDTVLGPRPDAEIEAEAKRLAAEWPSNVNPV